MKTFMIAVASVVGALTFSTTASADTFDNVCATKQSRGWVVTNIPSNYRDWQMNRALGEAIGDGNCVDGLQVVSSVDHRIVMGNNTRLAGVDSVVTSTLTNTKTTVTTADAGRITASWQGFAPEVLQGLSVARGGDDTKWKLVNSDGVNHTYKLKKQGIHPWPKGSRWVATDQAIIDRDFKGGTAIVPRLRWDKLRYAASRDTTTVERDYDVETVKTYNYSKTRVFCPAVWTYTFVTAEGQVLGSHQGHVGECQEKRYMATDTRVIKGSRSTTDVSVGGKYVTPQ